MQGSVSKYCNKWHYELIILLRSSSIWQLNPFRTCNFNWVSIKRQRFQLNYLELIFYSSEIVSVFSDQWHCCSDCFKRQRIGMNSTNSSGWSLKLIQSRAFQLKWRQRCECCHEAQWRVKQHGNMRTKLANYNWWNLSINWLIIKPIESIALELIQSVWLGVISPRSSLNRIGTNRRSWLSGQMTGWAMQLIPSRKTSK